MHRTYQLLLYAIIPENQTDNFYPKYTTEGKLIEETTHDQWWLRDEEFEKVVEPYIKEHLHNY